MAKVQVLEYLIYLTDKATVDAYNAQLDAGAGPGLLLNYYSPQTNANVFGVLRAPSTGAAIEFEAPFQTDAVAFLAPCTRSPWFNSGANFPTNVAKFTRKSGGWFGISALFGTTTTFYWAGRFAYAEPSAESTVPDPTPPPVLKSRHWIDGFETGDGAALQTGEGGSGGNPAMLREASRTHDGFGYGCRDKAASARTHTVMENRGGGASTYKVTWERFYLRGRRRPTTVTEVDLWFAQTQDGNNGLKVRLGNDGRLLLYKWVNGAAVLVATGSVLESNVWKKIDVVHGYRGKTPAWATDAPVGQGPGNAYGVGEWVTTGGLNYRCVINTATKVETSPGSGVYHDNDPAAASGFPHWVIESSTAGKLAYCRVYVNGVVAVEADGFSITAGVTAAENVHTTSTLGPVAANNAELDFDDWIASPCPTIQQGWNGGAAQSDEYPDITTLLTQADFNSGTHCHLLRPHGVVSQVDWTGAWQRATKPLVDNLDANNRITSSTAGALLALSTDITPATLREGATGVGACVVGCFYGPGGIPTGQDTVGGMLSQDTNNDGVANATPAFSALVTSPANGATGWRSAFYDANGLTPAPKLTALELRFTHGADAIERRVESLHAVVELIGTFGIEDVPAGSEVDVPLLPVPDPHHAHHAYSQWARTTGPKFGTASVIGGTYVGTGAPFDLTFPLPVSFLWIRRTAGTSTQQLGFRWWASMLAGHTGIDESIEPWVLSHEQQDRTFGPAATEDAQEQRWFTRLITADDKVNEVGVTYAYTAICDPAARYLRTGSTRHVSGFPVTDALVDDAFTPIAGFFWPEDRGATSTNRLAYKGPGHAVLAGSATLLAGTALTDYVDFGIGAITARTNLCPAGPEAAPFALFRLNDGNGEAPIFQHATYVGDGTGNRGIGLTPLFGKRPLFGVIVGSGALGRYRDVGHTGTTSTEISSGAASALNGIRSGGIDQINVGSELNANGITYHVFVIPGSATGTADGWSVTGTFYVSEPNSATPAGDFTPLEVDPGTSGPGSGDGTDPIPGDIEDDLADTACVTPSTKLVNLALQRIGVNKPIVTLATENTPEAAAVRLAYDATLQEVLCRLPWPFATRYTTLTLLAGTSASPANAEWQYSYRIPDDCLFPRRLVASRGKAVDPTPPPFRVAGGVILTNQASAVLEYTQRVHCPALAADPTFRSAWTWRLGEELAPALSRMENRAAYCREMYEAGIRTAITFNRLGAPGLKPAVDPADPDATCLVLKLRIVNRALFRIGAQTIAALDEQSREALGIALMYEDELRSTLRDFAWAFATEYANPLALVTGSVTTYASPDWVYAYRAPTNMLFARRIVRTLADFGIGRRFEREPAPFRVGADATGGLIYTNEETAVLEYTVRRPLDKADDLFRDAFSWRLAAAVAPSLAVPEPEQQEQTGREPSKETPRSEGGGLRRQQARDGRATFAWQMYLRTLAMARAANANEQQREPHDLQGDADWISGR